MNWNRREILAMCGTSAFAGQAAKAQEVSVLYGENAAAIAGAFLDKDHLWIPAASLPQANGFTLKPQGACVDEICIPVKQKGPDSLVRKMQGKPYFDLTAFAAKTGQAESAESAFPAFSYSDVPVLRGRDFAQGIAPGFTLPDRQGRPVSLSQYRGKKVLLLTWASW
ncbi:MAG: redoxin domain-containing protein [Bryobacteraceae bacterium]|nr:redoxin domain-containing protein [Bryobacteraceae bacterium]